MIKKNVLLLSQAICFKKYIFNKLVHAFEDCRSKLNSKSSLVTIKKVCS